MQQSMSTSFSYTPARKLPKPPRWLAVQAARLLHFASQKKKLRAYLGWADQVLAQEEPLQALTREQLQATLEQQFNRYVLSKTAQRTTELVDLMASLREIARRTLGLEAYRVQIAAALAMSQGYLVQLAPGEGKTLTLALAAAVAARHPQPCHLITTNDYLAERDADFLQPFYQACGLSVGKVLQEMSPEDKTQHYQADLVYSTAKQLLADFLTDQLRFQGPVTQLGLSLRRLQGTEAAPLMMRGLGRVLVDEADSVLIDEAITPMIISGPDANPLLQEAIEIATEKVEHFQSGVHYRLNPETRQVKWTQAGFRLLAEMALALPPLWRNRARYEDLMSMAVLARDYFTRDQHYVVQDDALVIIDESTGRAMPGRSWSYGLHQAIEARAGVPPSHPNKTLAKLSFQNYFKYYPSLSGASGTLQNIEQELYFNYRKQVLAIPSRLPSQLAIHPFQVYATKAAKTQALIETLKALHAQGYPLLIGTRSIYDSEQLADLLVHEGLTFNLLNAKQLAREADIIAQAGQPGAITLATNMAGRGTDIKVDPQVIEAGGLRVLMYEPHESARVDWQLYGRAGRQGAPGEAYSFVCLEDEVLKKHLPSWLLRLARLLLPLRLSRPWTLLVRFAQQRAAAKSFETRRFINEMTLEQQKRMSFIRQESG